MSKFTEMPEEDWIDSNEKGFTIHVKCTVTEGNVLIITRWEVTTRIDVTEEEQGTIKSLLGKPKLYL